MCSPHSRHWEANKAKTERVLSFKELVSNTVTSFSLTFVHILFFKPVHYMFNVHLGQIWWLALDEKNQRQIRDESTLGAGLI